MLDSSNVSMTFKQALVSRANTLLSTALSNFLKIALMLLGASSAQAADLLLDWDNEIWTPDGALTQTYNGAAQAPGSLIFTVTDSQAVLGSNTPLIGSSTNYDGGIDPTPDVLLFAADYVESSASGNFVDISLDFTGYGSGVSDVDFTFFDVDAGNNGGWIDELIVTAVDTNGNVLNPTSITVGASVTIDNVNTVSGTSSVTGGVNGNAHFVFAQANIVQINIRYSNIVAGTPNNQIVALHDISYTTSPNFSLLKQSATESDPVSVSAPFFNIPGAAVIYSITMTNAGSGTADAGSIFIEDSIPANTVLFVGDLVGGLPVEFIDGTPSSNVSLGNIEFSNDGGISYNYDPYVPMPPTDGYDSNVTPYPYQYYRNHGKLRRC